MSDLSGAQKKYLRGLAQGLKPVVHIGRNGLTEGVFESLEQALESHELIKVKFPRRGASGASSDHRDKKCELAAAIDARLRSVQVGAIGHVAVFFRRARDPERRSIRLPA